MSFNLALDLFPILAAVLAALTCGLLGNFLVLRRESLMGDAISHAVLPGLVIAFLLTSSRSPLLMLGGAALAGLLTVVLIEGVKKLGRVEPGAAMGVVFSVMFAFGVLLIEKAAARHVDLDADCVLYGQLETLVWFEAPATLAGLWSIDTLHALPRQVWLLVIMFFLALVFVAVLFKELRVAAFDPGLATSQGFHAGALHLLLMILVAAATVASFEAVGSILVIAMLIAPAATARLLTDRLRHQIGVSLVVAAAGGVGGYVAASAVPAWFDSPSVNAAGSITVVAGLLLVLAILFSPSHGLVARAVVRRRLAREAAVDDLLGVLWRLHESGQACVSPEAIASKPGLNFDRALRLATRRDWIHLPQQQVALTERGRQRANVLLRRHRLWEDYLVSNVGLSADHVHPTADRLEHMPIVPEQAAGTDPHGRPIPHADKP